MTSKAHVLDYPAQSGQPIRPVFFFTGNRPDRLLVDADNFCAMLAWRGWRRYLNFYVRVEGKTLYQAERGALIRDVSDLLEKEEADVSHAIMKQVLNLTVPTALELLPELQADILRDGRDNICLPFRNGLLVISEAGFEMLPYEMVEKQVWSHKIIDRDFRLLPPEQYRNSPWYRFLTAVCTRPQRNEFTAELRALPQNFEAERFTALQATLGKLIHTYNNPSNPVAVILTDETGWEDENTGGTGKSLLAEAVKHLRKGITIQCRDRRKGDSFFFDSVFGDMDLLILDDLDSNVMAFSQLYGHLSGGLEVNRKGEHHFKYAFEDNPRFVITTNQAVKGNDVSDVRRRWDMQLLPFFDEKFQPRALNHGANFFENWTAEDWLCFDNAMAECCLVYFQTRANHLGCPAYPSNTVERSVREETGNEIIDWLDGWKADLSEGGKNCATEPLTDFRERYNTETNSHVKNAFTKWIAKWAKLRNVELEIKQERYLDKSQKVIHFSWIPF